MQKVSNDEVVGVGGRSSVFATLLPSWLCETDDYNEIVSTFKHGEVIVLHGMILDIKIFL